MLVIVTNAEKNAGVRADCLAAEQLFCYVPNLMELYQAVWRRVMAGGVFWFLIYRTSYQDWETRTAKNVDKRLQVMYYETGRIEHISSKTTEIYTHVGRGSIQKIPNPIDGIV